MRRERPAGHGGRKGMQPSRVALRFPKDARFSPRFASANGNDACKIETR
ncbi:hypothetical protein TGS27_0714 [Geobacillus stearothermophilus]|uniref:Uncharacterized protein n=1 Tax=Geobacillus stearothermophilus TaxID=1422 RepID=A0A150NB05_GEOSE|nr:hypothetical protein GS8_1025 [Geobacillus stearothermophilus]KYD33879.1 hypothetical protein B4114_1305 [Geobacillus stearothermophilus]OAO85399.1 hypothetical protein TGS27_0714 [Geobacillus stearothermophilus]